MNKEVVKAMNKEQTKIHYIKKWWRKNGYKVMRIIFFPVWASIRIKDKLNSYICSKNNWSEERADEILKYYIPRVSEWDAEDKVFYFADNGLGWKMKAHQKKIKIKDRNWWKYNAPFGGGKVRTYLIEKFELNGFEKIVGDTYDGWTEISFKMIEK